MSGMNRRYQRRFNVTPTGGIEPKREPLPIFSDSEEEERNVNMEIHSLFQEFEHIQDQLTRTRTRLRRLYEKREKIRIKQAIRKRELEIRKDLNRKWLPNLESVNNRVIETRLNILNGITPLTNNEQSVTLRERNREENKEILNNLCGPNLSLVDDELD